MTRTAIIQHMTHIQKYLLDRKQTVKTSTQDDRMHRMQSRPQTRRHSKSLEKPSKTASLHIARSSRLTWMLIIFQSSCLTRMLIIFQS